MARILVVDDSPTTLEWTCQALRCAGHEARGHASIWVAPVVGEFRPHLTLVDVKLGAASGPEIIKALTVHGRETSIFVLYSSLGPNELSPMAAKCGAAGYISKTPDADLLVREVERFLGR